MSTVSYVQKRKMIAFAAALVLSTLPTLAAASLVEKIATADAVVTAKAEMRPVSATEAHLYLVIGKALKGELSGVKEAWFHRNPDPRLGPVAGSTDCGIFLLSKHGSEWWLIPQSEPVLDFHQVYFPSNHCNEARPEQLGSSVDRVLREYMQSVEDGIASTGDLYHLFSSVRPRQSAEVDRASKHFVKSANTDVRLLGLAWRITEGDVLGLQQGIRDLPSFLMPPFDGLLSSSLGSYSNPDPAGIGCLNVLAGSGNFFVEQAASTSLLNIHSRDTLPYLVALLDSKNAVVRENAVTAFTLFLVGAAPYTEGDNREAFDRAFNPASKKSLSGDEDAHLHLGPFQNKADEEEMIRWWRTWYERDGKRL